jgi:branched-chain amino acid transport system substrate-binding protein
LVLFPYGAYDSLFQKDNPFLFCTVAAFSDLGKSMAAYAVKNGYKRIAVYHNGKQSQEELVTAFELALKNSETKVVDYIPNISSQSEFNNIYHRWQALDVDCVIIAQYGLERAFEVLKMLRSKDKDMPVIGEPIFNRASALLENKVISEGLVVPSTLVIEENEKLENFKEKYRQKYKNEADIWAIQGYDMLRLIVDTATRLGTNNPVRIAEALHSEAGYRGIGSNIAFNKGGAMVLDEKKLPMLKCKDGRF